MSRDERELEALRHLADRVRLRAVQMTALHGLGYLGQALSSAELFACLYGGAFSPGRDEFVCSPGHYVIAFYGVAAETGLLDPGALSTYGFDDSLLEAVGTERTPGLDLVFGSLGLGLSGGVGFALARRMRGQEEGRVFVLVSDGEMEEGQVWEAALFAAHERLDRLVVVIDANDSQVDGPVHAITTLEPLADKWRAFGWEAVEVDGHDVGALSEALDPVTTQRPRVVIARTSTRTGLEVLPVDADGHFIKLSDELATAAIAELEARLA